MVGLDGGEKMSIKHDEESNEVFIEFDDDEESQATLDHIFEQAVQAEKRD
jgi:hypothetical protein